MYTVLEHRSIGKMLRKASAAIRRSYQAWKRIVELEGPRGLRFIKGFHDESLRGEWKGYRSSRLNVQWRVIYRIENRTLVVFVVEITPHEY
jgi:addiction module RelE/StbE family toxin